MTRSLTFLVLAALSLADSAPADNANLSPQCPNPAVATPDAARSVYTREPDGVVKAGRDLLVVDEGDHWTVFQRHRDLGKITKNPDGTETVVVQTGSDGLVLDIDKCTGATRGYYAR